MGNAGAYERVSIVRSRMLYGRLCVHVLYLDPHVITELSFTVSHRRTTAMMLMTTTTPTTNETMVNI